MPSTQSPPRDAAKTSAQQLRAKALEIADLLADAKAKVDAAGEILSTLCADLDGVDREFLPRFDYEVNVAAKGIASDLGVSDEKSYSEFDLDRTARDAADLVDLIDFASKRSGASAIDG